MRKGCLRKAQAGESVCLCVNGSGWAVVILCMRQSFFFFVNGGVLVGAVKAAPLQQSRVALMVSAGGSQKERFFWVLWHHKNACHL